MKSPHFVSSCSEWHRRQFLRHALLGSAAFFTVPGAFAETLTLTPKQTEGPFYPDKLPLDTDNDLLIVNDGITPAVGDVTHLTGTVRASNGDPVKNALVEIWQVDAKGNYLHSRGGNPKTRDGNFQGYGRFVTDLKGGYYFRTIKPHPYGPRTAHIHVAVSVKGKRTLTTQCYIEGHPQNDRDRILNSVRNPEQRDSLIIPFRPMPDSKAGELTANFDMVLGWTPESA